MIRLLISLIILSVAIILFAIFAPLGIAYALFVCLYTLDFSYIPKVIKRISVSIDQLGNVVAGQLLNKIFLKQGEKFGFEDDTVSEVLAKNQHNVTRLGRIISIILEKLDRNHLQKSLEENGGIE